MASSAVANMQQPFVNAPLITAPPAAFASGMALPADAMRAPTFVGGADAAVFTAGVGNETVITGGSGASAMIICGALEIGNEPPAVGYSSAGNLIIGNTLVSGAGNSVMGNGLISGTGRLQRSSLATEKGGELVVEAASRSALENWSKWAATNVKAGDVATFLREAHAVSVMSETQSNNGSVTVTLSDQTKITFIGAMTAVGARLV
jgi:hypothetical protein